VKGADHVVQMQNREVQGVELILGQKQLDIAAGLSVAEPDIVIEDRIQEHGHGLEVANWAFQLEECLRMSFHAPDIRLIFRHAGLFQ
jgi:hypothetical protein